MTPPAADTVIVGGGVIGCALAAELAARGRRVTVVERGDPGGEASGAAAGLLTPQVEARTPGPLFALALESRSLYPEWAASLLAETGIDVGYRRTGFLQCDFGAAGEPLSAAYHWQTERGLRVEDRARPALSDELDGRLSPEVARAVFFPDEAVVDPPRLARATWLLAQRRGVRVLRGTPVTGLLLDSGACRGVETVEGPIAARNVVVAAGAWAALDQMAGISVPVHPVRGQIVKLRVDGMPLGIALGSEGVYIVPRPDGTVLVGSTMERVGFRKEVTAAAVARLLQAAVRLVPALAAARFETAWSGLRPGTPDELPILGASAIPGLFFAAGHFRNGILLAPVTARRVADAMEGRAAPDLSAFSPGRFAGTLAPSPLGTSGAAPGDFS